MLGRTGVLGIATLGLGLGLRLGLRLEPRLGAITLGPGVGIGGRGAAGRTVSAVPSVPRKSFTRVSTSWLIDTLLASQNAFSRSYVERLTLMLRRVCFLAMIPLYATGSTSSSRAY
jgi:hypothetical protein